MNNQVNPMLAKTINILISQPEQLFKSDEQIIEGMKQNNATVLGKLREEPEEDKEDSVQESFAKMDSLLDEQAELTSQLKELAYPKGQTIFTLRNHIKLDKAVQEAQEAFLIKKRKEIANKQEILSGKYNIQKMNSIYVDMIDSILDIADRDMTLKIDRMFDNELYKIEEE